MLVGRHDDLTYLREWVHGDAGPLTLVGPFGVGKSALARVVVREYQQRGAPVCCLDFAREGEAALEAMRSLLAGNGAAASTLVLLDNIDGFHTPVRHCLNSMMRSTLAYPKVLLTSRTRLGHEGESIGYVKPLSVLEGAELFRRAARGHGYRGTSWDPLVLARIVQRLDALPLAIHLCARYAVSIPATSIESSLEDHQAWLQNADADCQPNHDTWDAGWRLALSDLPNQVLEFLVFLSLFDETFTFDDITSACVDCTPVPHLTLLHERSLVVFDATCGTYALLNSVRSYVRRTYPSSRAQTEDFVRFLHHGASRAQAHIHSDESAGWLMRHRVSLLDAFEQASSTTADSVNLLLGAARAAAWGGPVQRTVELLRRFDKRVWECLPAPLRISLHQARAKLEARLENVERARTDYLCARDIMQSQSDATVPEEGAKSAELCLTLLTDLGTFQRQQGSPESESTYTEALQMIELPGVRFGKARLLTALATRATEEHEFEEATMLFERAYQAARSEKSALMEAVVLSNRGVLGQEQGRLAEAQMDFLQARDLHHLVGHQRFEAIAELDLGCLALEQGRYPAARNHFEAAIALTSRVEDRSQTALGLTLLATAVSLQAQPAHAEPWFSNARDAFENVANPYLLAAHRVHSAQQHANAAQQAFIAGDLAGFDAELQSARLVLGHQWTVTSDELRLAQRLLQRRIDACADLPNSLLVAGDGGWLQKPPLARVVLKFDSPQRRVLNALVTHYNQGTDRPLAPETLVRSAWPAEKLMSKSAMNRLHVALNALRKSGLSDHLQHTSSGYVLLKVLPQP
jgi:tetratricopeptide (TPR) repeat protein